MTRQILVVDDDSAIRYAVSLFLRRAGYRVSVAKDGQEGLVMIAKAQDEGLPYQLLVTDIRMPRMSGDRLIASLRRVGADLPVVAMTAVADPVLRHRLAALGCVDLFEKPFDLKRMKARIGEIFEEKDQSRDSVYRRMPLGEESRGVPAGL